MPSIQILLPLVLDIIRKLGRLFSSSTTSAAKIALSPGLLVRCFISIEQTRVVAIVPQIFLPTTTTTSDDHFFQTKKTTKDTKSNRTKPELREESFTVRWRRKEVLTVLSSLHILLDCCRQPCLPQQNSEEESESCATARVLPSSLLTSYRGEAFGSQDEALPNASLASKLSLSLSLSLSLVSASSASLTAFLTSPGTENKVSSDSRSRPRIDVHDSESRTSSRNR